MPKEEQIRHSILAVSGDEKIFPLIRRSLRNGSIMSAEHRSSAVEARRSILERYYTIVVINSPLSDESGVEFAIDTAGRCNASILLIVPAGIYTETVERVSDYGIMVIGKPIPVQRINQVMRYLSACQSKLIKIALRLEAAEEKVEEIRMVDKAKFYLVEHRHMTEDEAHRYIGKQAMDHGVSRKRIAQEILDEEG